jgi:hypothetical protein
VSEKLLTQIYNAFDPKRPLEPDDPFYVQCHDVRGDENIINEVGRKFVGQISRRTSFTPGIEGSESLRSCGGCAVFRRAAAQGGLL